MVTSGGYHAQRKTPLYQSRSCAARTGFSQHIAYRCRTHSANANGVESADAATAKGGDLWNICPGLRVRRLCLLCSILDDS